MNYKLLALDLDGTLLNSKKEISPKTKEILLEAQKKGLTLILASGRPEQGVLPYARQLELDRFGGFTAAFNGGKIVDLGTGETVFQQTIEPELLPLIYRFAQKNKAPLLTYDSKIVTEDEPNSYMQIESRINQMEIRQVDRFLDYVSFPVTKCLIPEEPNKVALMESDLRHSYGDRLNVFRSEPYFLEIMPPRVDKAYSLSKLLHILGYSRQDLCAAGDGFNDITMLQYAGLGVAMCNGQPITKHAADRVTTLDNDHDGIAELVENFVYS